MTDPSTSVPILDAVGLGRLRRVAQPRQVWPTETGHFTPWLAANLDILSEEMGLALTLVSTEVQVGDFRLDIKAETVDGRVVIIENQLERTDHSHLGQLMVYASGLEAAIVVWIAPSFRDEFRGSLDWLNERTDEGVSFFGVEVGIVQIGEGPKAPVFEIVARPNDWQKHLKGAGSAGTGPNGVTPLNELRQDFFAQVLAEISSAKPAIRIPARSRGNWLSFASGPFGYWCISVTNERRVRLEAYLDNGDSERNKALFDYIKLTIAAPADLVVSWERLDERRASRIAVYYDEVPPYDDASGSSAITWARDTFVSLHDAFDSELRTKATALRLPTAPTGVAPPVEPDKAFAPAHDGLAPSPVPEAQDAP